MARDDSDGPGWLPFDLLGHPVPRNKGKRGRPQHAPTAENLEKAILLYAADRSDADVAAAIGITIPTLKQHYFSSLELQRARRNARMIVEGELLARLNRLSLAGNVAATEKLLKRIDKLRLGPMPLAVAPARRRKGVKEERAEAAYTAGQADEDWGPLLHGETGGRLAN